MMETEADGIFQPTKCSFYHTFNHIICSKEIIHIKNLLKDQQITLLSELSLVPPKVFVEYTICSEHQTHTEKLLFNRNRVKTCQIPDILNTHRKAVKADRHLGPEQILNIQKGTGIVLPVSTAICRHCRQKLLSSSFIDNEDDIPISAKTASLSGLSEQEKIQLSLQKEQPLEDQIEYVEECSRPKRKRLPEQNPVYTTDNENDSQQESLAFSQNTADSSYSQGSSFVSEKNSPMKQLNAFLSTVNVSPVLRIKDSLATASKRTERRYAAKAKQCLSAVLNTICPGEGDKLLELVSPKETQSDRSFEEALKEAYGNSQSWTVQRQLLSIIAIKKPFAYVKQLIPSLTSYRYNVAKRHGLQYGIGVPVPSTVTYRQSIDPAKLEIFLDFITSSNVIKDLPFGEKTMKLSSGETIKTPNAIRCLAPATILRQFEQYCEENGLESLGHSTMYKILQECPASFQKSMEGLDYYIVEGGRAFEDLAWVVRQLHLNKDEEDVLLKDLAKSKTYLKCDYKIHLQEEAETPTHCISLSLSDSDPLFACDCDHSHEDQCSNCHRLGRVLSIIDKHVQEAVMDDDKLDEIMFKTTNGIHDINEWQKHIVRSRNQMRAKTNVISNLSDSSVIVMVDWAMKFLPRKFREGQTDWFAKRGINWHIAVCLSKSHTENAIETLTIVHLFSNPISQDAFITSAVLVDIANSICKIKPAIKDITFWSDNAGCYKSTLTLCSLFGGLGPRLSAYHFCEAQDGKGPCDRKSSHIKADIKRYVNEGNNVLDALSMKKAIDSKQRSYLCKVVECEDQNKPKLKSIPNITSYNNFVFTEEHLTVWKAYGIGSGNLSHGKRLEP